MEKYKKVLCYALIFLVGLIIYQDIFDPGFLVKSDNPVHMVEAQYLADVIIPEQQWINAWHPFELAGNPIQMYSYQLGVWLVVFLYKVVGLNLFLGNFLAICYKYTTILL